jgi:thioredoxin reductase (NADPH)
MSNDGTSGHSNESSYDATAETLAGRVFDCVVVGGGPAGLSAAVNLGRMKRSALVVDDRNGRSLWGQTNRNYLGFPDGIKAAEIRLAGREQAARYGARFLLGKVSAAVRDGEDFRLMLEPCDDMRYGGREANVERDVEIGRSLGEQECREPIEVTARSIVIATGVRDRFPHFPGWMECVGRSLFWCINCDGYETIGRKVVVVGHDEDSAQTALELLDFTPDITMVAGHPDGFDLPAGRLEQLAAEGIAAHPCDVAEYENSEGRIAELVLADPVGTRLPVEMVFTYRPPIARTEVAQMLGVALNPIGQIVVDEHQMTNVPGVYAAGDVTSPHDHQISAAVHEGNEAAAAANYYLYRPVQKAHGRAD